MRSDWKLVAMEDEVRLLSGGTPKKSEGRFWNGEIPWVSSGEMTQSRIFDTQHHVTEEAIGSGTRSVPKNTVLVVVRGMSLAKEFRVALTERRVTFNQDLKALRPSAKIDPGFLFYYLQSQRNAIRDRATDASHGTKKVETHVLKNWPLPLLSMKEQLYLRDILSAYDDLIENNRRRIRLLEQSARLLYKEWFVHLRFPGHEHVSVVDGVPEGWERRPLGECAKFLSGGTPSKAKPEFWEGEIPWVSSGELRTMRIHRTKLNVTSAAIKSGSRLVPKGTILAVVRGMSLAKEFRIGITARPVSFNQDIKALIGVDEIDTIFLFHAIDSQKDRIRDLSGDASHGTKKIDTPVLFAIPILAPPPTVQAAFRQIIAKLHDQWDILDNTNVGLQEARDLLLPRLMNGEIPV